MVRARNQLRVNLLSLQSLEVQAMKAAHSAAAATKRGGGISRLRDRFAAALVPAGVLLIGFVAASVLLGAQRLQAQHLAGKDGTPAPASDTRTAPGR